MILTVSHVLLALKYSSDGQIPEELFPRITGKHFPFPDLSECFGGRFSNGVAELKKLRMGPAAAQMRFLIIRCI
jgi:hypothetical protein